MGYQRINIIIGWFSFLIALVLYLLTVEPTASFWDCGEFIACSYKLEVPHPPGAPFFLLIGRMFSMLALGDVTQVAYWVNILSVLSSAFAILFLFWSITHLVKRVLGIKSGEETEQQTILIMAAGFVGAMACTFSDTFWFSAVEAEVYGMSAFFTAFVFWAILKWENIEDDAKGNKWLILIAYMIGLSIGVHLLNLVTIPAMALIFYFKKYQDFNKRGIILTLAGAFGIIMVVMLGVIPGLPSLAGSLEIFFVNGLGLPFGSGTIFFGLAFLGGLIYGIIYSVRKRKMVLNTALLCFTFIMIGYSSYTLVLIRSTYNPPIDENNPEDILSFVSYLKREQYGSRPLIHGHYFTAPVISQERGATVYMRGEDKYEVKDYKVEYVYDPQHTTILPRMYSTDGRHVQRYREITGLAEGEKPTFIDNLNFMFTYQLGHMYMRYFLWNFSGRASDIQGARSVGLIPDNDIPNVLQENAGRNIYYALPLLLGLLGMFIQFRKDQKYFWVTLLLFFLTGAALVLYLNSPPIEPRERDYIYAGSYYVFAIWIGFGVLAIYDLFSKFIRNGKVAAALAGVLALSIPTLMAMENWDDHDRSDRYFSVDAAKNYLNSCAPNAIIFTGGDNDTFPLWYAQEVEGFRTDVRVIVLSYFNTDWYINQMMRPAYESKPLPFGLTAENYRQGGPNDYLVVMENKGIQGSINARQYLNLVKAGDSRLQVPSRLGSTLTTIPAKSMSLPVDVERVKSLGIIPEEHKDKIVDRMTWGIKESALYKSDLAVIDLIVNSNWERPIYFNTTSLFSLNFDIRRYVVQEGIAYRLLPISSGSGDDFLVDTDLMYDNMMNNYFWRNLDDPDVYYSEDYRNFCLNHRSAFNTLGAKLLEKGDTERAKAVMFKSLEVMPNESIPFDEFNVQQVSILLGVGEEAKANEIADIAALNAQEYLDYLFEKGINDRDMLRKKLFTLNELTQAYKAHGYDERAANYEQMLNAYYGRAQQAF